LDFDYDQRLITVQLPDTATTVQELVNLIRDEEDELINLDDPRIIDAAGKDDLGGGNKTAITMTLVNGWLLAFAARTGPATVLCTVSGGNLVALDKFGVAQYPIFPTAFTSVSIAQSTAPALPGGALTVPKFLALK
jgi:hypothetical protein